MGTPPPIMMANLGMADTLILMVLALVVFGPRRLPQIGRQIGKLMYEFRKASNDFKFQMEEELRNAEEADRRKKEEEERQRALAAAPSSPQIEAATSAVAESPSAATPASSAADPAALSPATDASISAAPENPYLSDLNHSEMTVPEVATESTPPVESSPTPEPEADESTSPGASSPTPGPEAAAPVIETAPPRIMPPSTGETVAADRPGAQHQQRELFAAEPGKTPESVTPEAERSEPATHHG